MMFDKMVFDASLLNISFTYTQRLGNAIGPTPFWPFDPKMPLFKESEPFEEMLMMLRGCNECPIRGSNSCFHRQNQHVCHVSSKKLLLPYRL